MVELDVSRKDLTDDGFLEVASALVEAISYDGDQGRVARLEELCLRSNRLTIASLQALTPVIEVSCSDLRDLDLSENQITISSDADVAIWEDFLISFKKCCVLRRIDFSGNALGDRAFEVMVRVYAKEEPLNFSLPSDLKEAHYEEQSPTTEIGGVTRKTKKMSLGSNQGDHTVDEGHHKRKVSKQGHLPSCASYDMADANTESVSPEKTSLPALPVGPLLIHTTTRGLRSVPYFVLRDTSMTDICALHLSYIIAHHHKPSQLLTRVPPVKAGFHAQQLIEYDTQSQCQGIIYLPNAALGNTGLKVLELADTIRDMPLDGTADEDAEGLCTPAKSSAIPRRASNFHYIAPLVSSSKRRQSLMSTEDILQAEKTIFTHNVTNLDRARSRIQGDALQEAGPLSNDLWRVALRMLCLGRNIQAQEKKEPPPVPKGKAPVIKTLSVPGPRLKPLTPKPAMPLTAERDANRPVVPWGKFSQKSSSIPQTLNMSPTSSQQVPFDGRGRLPPVDSRNIRTQPPVHTATPSRVVSLSAKNKIYRTRLPCGFSEDVWRRIIGTAAGADGIMSEDQQRSMLSWAMNRNTLSKESEILGLTLASQIWRVLEGTGCLTYDMDG